MTGSSPNPGAIRARFATAYQALEEAIAAQAFPGCAFGVLAKDEVILQDALGRFTYEPDAPAVRLETIYDVASVTKVVATTAAAMLLNQQGRLDVDTQLGTLLPEFLQSRPTDDPARTITLRHLLAHNSGLPGYVKFFETVSTPEALLQACLQLQLEAEPGSRAEYSDPGFILLGRALEVAIDEPLAQWTKREIFAPLGLKATCFCPERDMWAMIPPTEEDTTFRHRRIQGEVQDENAYILGGVAGHAGLFSNVPDLLRFAGEILHAGKTGARLFHRQTVEFFAQRQRPEGSSRALGWDTPSEKSSSGKHFSRHSIGHLGYSGCSLWIDLDAAIAVVLLTNRTWPDRACQKIREVRPAFHDAVRRAL
ncbi:MAG TPA: serine hydrolase domain-containing protein [Terracidiphilus sp.]|nr:serine hydrolase domain-containing protein [Terracidiphilus sp.]